MGAATKALSLAFLSYFVLLAAEKPDFTGTWRMSGGERQPTLIIKQSGDNIQISSAGTTNTETKVTCNTMGRECEARVAGEQVKVTYYYNGPVLVEMIFAGKNSERVTKTRRTLSDHGTRMTVEILTLVPAGREPVKVIYLRDQPVSAPPAVS